MFREFFRFPTIAAIAAAVIVLVATGASEARDWRRAVERHYKAAEAEKFTPNGENPQWDFDLQTTVNDMAWRARTAAMLRDLPKPGVEREESAPSQLADSEEPRPLQFRF